MIDVLAVRQSQCQSLKNCTEEGTRAHGILDGTLHGIGKEQNPLISA